MPIILAGLLCLLIPFHVQAINSLEGDALFDLSLDQLLQVKVSGSTLTEEDLSTVPAAVTVFTAQQLELMGFESVQDLMAMVPGYQSFRSANSSTNLPYSSRGRLIGNPSAEVLVMVDGQRLDDPVTNGPNSIMYAYPTSFIERIEFIRGPGSAVYGSNAMTGLINIITKSDKRQLSMSYGSHERKLVNWLHHQELGKMQLDIRARLEEDEGDSFLEPDSFSNDTVKTTDPLELGNLELDVTWLDTKLHVKRVSTKGKNFYNTGRLSEGFNFVDAQYQSVGLKHKFNWHKIHSWYWLGQTKTDLNISTQNTAPGDLLAISGANEPLFLLADLTGSQENRIQWHNDWHVNKTSSIQFGAEFRQTQIDEQFIRANYNLDEFTSILSGQGSPPLTFYGNFNNKFTVRTPRDRDILGIYGQYQNQISERFKTVLGLRYDRFAGIGEELSPRTAFIYQPHSNTVFKLLYGQAYRAPSHSELYSVNNPVLLANPNLKPETAKTWDFIWQRNWQKHSMSLGVFESSNDNAISRRPTSGADQFENTDLDPSQGTELEVTSVISSQWTAYYNLTHFFALPDLAYREAETFGSVMLTYKHQKLQGSLLAAYAGERETSTLPNDEGRVTLDDYWQFTAKVLYKLKKDVTLHASVRNLLDEDYRTPASTLVPALGTPNRGREILMGLEWAY